MMSDMPHCFDARPLYMCMLSRKLGQRACTEILHLKLI